MLKIFLNKRASKILETITEGVDYGHARKIDNAPGAFMAVHVERVNTIESNPVFSVSHYYEQNGDLMRDPDVEFMKQTSSDGAKYWIPISYRQDGLGIAREYLILNEEGKITDSYQVKIEDCAKFCNMWMVNIYEQQRLKENKIQREKTKDYGMIIQDGSERNLVEDYLEEGK